MQPTIREIRKEDNLKIKMIIQSSLESLNLAIEGTAYYDKHLGNLYEYYKGLKNATYWVVELNGEVVGGVGIAQFESFTSICELQKLYLVPEAQGRGLSKELLDIALNFATKHYDKCYLETSSELSSATSLYEKFGFDLLDKPLGNSEHTAMNLFFVKELKFKF